MTVLVGYPLGDLLETYADQTLFLAIGVDTLTNNEPLEKLLTGSPVMQCASSILNLHDCSHNASLPKL